MTRYKMQPKCELFSSLSLIISPSLLLDKDTYWIVESNSFFLKEWDCCLLSPCGRVTRTTQEDWKRKVDHRIFIFIKSMKLKPLCTVLLNKTFRNLPLSFKEFQVHDIFNLKKLCILHKFKFWICLYNI